ncbi:MarR family transcriptional regulator [Streptomyces triticirhizae]|uniref:MarR family transcriptional regulator n=2 Tax=Streptomyces triticirhizae TaxID=2483353 RepID=A0A3M2KR05_9ACTN|nr:MarR family transcriptional regulator [Streptomyces triticirhizae]RMI27899.1 MarR family transcriptional regulator [Streptomyces triticirhizae]
MTMDQTDLGEAETEKPGEGPGAEITRNGDPYPREVAAFVERFAADLVAAGFQRMAARVFACLTVSEEGALSSAELAERLRVSPAAISGAVRYLSQVHLISREREPGSRRERYRLHQNVWYEAMTQRDAYLRRWETTVRGGVEIVGPDTPAGRRLSETAEFMAFLEEEMDQLMERWHARRAVSAHPLEQEPEEPA